MAIAFRSQTAPSTTGTIVDPIVAIALPSGAQAGDMIGLIVGFKYSAQTIAAQPTGWQDPTNNEDTGGAGASGVDTGVIRCAAWFREYDGVWSMPSIDLSAAPNVAMSGAIAWSKGAGETWEPVVCGNGSDTAGSATQYGAVAGESTDWAVGDVLGAFTTINGDAGTVGTVTLDASGAALDTLQARYNVGTSTGQDMRTLLHDRAVTANPVTVGPTMLIAYTGGNASMGGATIFYRLRVTAAGGGLPPMSMVTWPFDPNAIRLPVY